MLLVMCDQGGIPCVLLVMGCVTRKCAPGHGLCDQGGIPRVLLVIGCVTWKGFLVCSW